MADSDDLVSPGADNELALAFTHFHSDLKRFLAHRVGAEFVDDLLQDVFVKAVKGIKAGTLKGNLQAWLFQVARTTVVDHFRRRRGEFVEIDAEALFASEDSDQAHHELAECLRPMVVQLPGKYANILLKADLGGERLADIAQEEQVSLSAIKSRASRGRRLLRAKLLACCEVELKDGRVRSFEKKSLCCKEC